MNNIVEEQIVMISDTIKEILLEKNKRYGNAALKPQKIFNKLSSENSIKIRIDDKLSRIMNSEEIRTNDIVDIIGYLELLLISMNVEKKDLISLID